MSIVELTKENFEQEVLGADVPVLIDFWAGWCGPCMMQSPIVDEIAEELEGRVKVCKVNVDEQAALALEYRVVSIPTLVFMNKGVFQERMVGLQDKQTIVDYLNTL
jgi:thioredoxin 1